ALCVQLAHDCKTALPGRLIYRTARKGRSTLLSVCKDPPSRGSECQIDTDSKRTRSFDTGAELYAGIGIASISGRGRGPMPLHQRSASVAGAGAQRSPGG